MSPILPQRVTRDVTHNNWLTSKRRSPAGSCLWSDFDAVRAAAIFDRKAGCGAWVQSHAVRIKQKDRAQEFGIFRLNQAA